MLTGGIIAYDSNVLTGGAGANFLGIGGSTEYRRDNVSVFLRAVSVATGEVLASVTTDKTIYSVSLQGMASKYVGWNKLLQIEAGVTTNEPRQLAVRQAIEKAVHALVLEGADKGYWSFADQGQGRQLILDYQASRDERFPLRLPRKVPRADRWPRRVQGLGGRECLKPYRKGLDNQMRNLLLATVALIGLAGAAHAQSFGNQAYIDQINESGSTASQDQYGVSINNTARIRQEGGSGNAASQAQTGSQLNVAYIGQVGAHQSSASANQNGSGNVAPSASGGCQRRGETDRHRQPRCHLSGQRPAASALPRRPAPATCPPLPRDSGSDN